RVPFLDRDLEPRAARQHAHQRGVVDQHVDRAEAVERGLRHRLVRLLAGDVGRDADRPEALRGERLGHRFGGGAVDVGRDHPGAGLGEFLRIDLADALAAAGDDDGTPSQIKPLVHGCASKDGEPVSRPPGARYSVAPCCSSLPMPSGPAHPESANSRDLAIANLYRAHERLAIGGGTLLAFLLAWEVTARLGLVDPLFISSPTQVPPAGYAPLRDPDFWNDARVSGIEFVLGYGAAVAIAVPLGLASGLSRRLRYLISPFVDPLNAVPRVTLLPLIVIWFGIGIWSKVVVVFLGAFIPILINTQSGVGTSEARYLRLARSFSASRWKIFSSVVLPGTVPFIFTGLKYGAGRALLGVVVGELYAATAGLGHMIADAGNTFQTDVVFFGVLVFMAAGLVVVALLDRLERHFETWRPNAR